MKGGMLCNQCDNIEQWLNNNIQLRSQHRSETCVIKSSGKYTDENHCHFVGLCSANGLNYIHRNLVIKQKNNPDTSLRRTRNADATLEGDLMGAWTAVGLETSLTTYVVDLLFAIS